MPAGLSAARALARRLPERDDRGAVAVFVGIMLSTGVLFVMFAFAVDWGLINYERAQGQRAADAASYALAWQCARLQPSCATAAAAQAWARSVASANAEDDLMAIQGICGIGEATQSWLTACPNPPTGVTRYVRVTTTTQTTAGDFLTLPFSGLVAPGDDKAVVTASAQASWTTGGTKPAMIVRRGSSVPTTGSSEVETWRRSGSNGDGYTRVASPGVSGCDFTTLPAVASNVTLNSATTFAASGMRTCLTSSMGTGPPYVVLVTTQNNRQRVTEWRIVTSLSWVSATTTDSQLRFTWGAATTSGVTKVTMLP